MVTTPLNNRLRILALVAAVAMAIAACGDSQGGSDESPATSGSPETTDSGSSETTDPGSAAEPNSIQACVEETTGGEAVAEKQAVELTFVSHDRSVAEVLANRAEELSAMDASPYSYSIVPDIISSGEVPTKAITAYSTGTDIPDLLGIEISRFATFMDIASDVLVDYTDQLGELREQNDETRWQTWSVDDRIYAIESSMSYGALFYRQDEFERLGIPTPIETWDEYLEHGRRVFEEEGIYLGSIDHNFSGLNFTTGARGGSIFDGNGNLLIDTPETREAAAFIAEGVRDNVLLDFPVGDFHGAPQFAAMQNGEVISYFFPIWWLKFFLEPQVPDQAGLWRAQPLPRFEEGGHPTSLHGGLGVAISKDSDNVDASWLLVKCGLMTAEGQVKKFDEVGYLPVNDLAWQSEVILESEDEFLGGQKLGALFASIKDDSPTQFQNPAWSFAVETIGREFPRYIDEEITLDEFIESTTEAIEAEMANNS